MILKKLRTLISKNILNYLVIVIFLAFSSWLMFSTFSYGNGSMLIASKAWSDFASHIPLIRSFSFGSNFPPEYPLFSGEAIRYHFIFYSLVCLLEKIGTRIDFALNIPSILSLTALIFMIYFLANKLFKSKTIALLSVIFFLFNSSFSFLEFFKIHPLSINVVKEIFNNTVFPSFGPYDGKIISAFWNLNIYTNQRHLAAAYFFSLLIFYLLISPLLKDKKPNLKLSLMLGLVLGLSYFFHTALFLINIIIISLLFLLLPKIRLSTFVVLTVGGLVALPQYLYMQGSGSTFRPLLNPGYLIGSDFSLITFLSYWTFNLGLNLILIPLGFLLIDKRIRKILLPFLLLFLIGNTFQFSLEMAANHKFFNYFMIIGNMLSAYFLIFLWKKNIFLKPLVIVLFFFLVLSGIIDFFPIYNDSKIKINDYPINKDIAWIMKNTPPNSVFLNTSYIYDSASLAGRKIYLGWPYFAWSAGYDTDKRGKLIESIFQETNKEKACQILLKNHIDYVGIKLQNPDFKFSDIYIKRFNANFKSKNNYNVLGVKENCIEK